MGFWFTYTMEMLNIGPLFMLVYVVGCVASLCYFISVTRTDLIDMIHDPSWGVLAVVTSASSWLGVYFTAAWWKQMKWF